MAELADAQASGACGHYARGGSTPLIRIFSLRGLNFLLIRIHVGNKLPTLPEFVIVKREDLR